MNTVFGTITCLRLGFNKPVMIPVMFIPNNSLDETTHSRLEFLILHPFITPSRKHV